MTRTRTVADGILVGLFLAALGGYAVASLANFVSDDQVAAALARPWKTLPARVEKQFTTSLAARERLNRWYSEFKVGLLRASTNPKVCLGRGGWLFYDQTAETGFFRASDPAEAARLECWAGITVARRAWLAERGIQFVAVIVPDKQSVYPEVAPRVAKPLGPSPLDRFAARVRAVDPDLCLLDLRGPLLAAKQARPVYLRTDTHWNQDGAYVGYATTVQSMARWCPALKPEPREAFDARPVRLETGDLVRMLGLPGRMPEEYTLLQPRGPGRARMVDEAPRYQKAVALAHIKPKTWVQDDPSLPRVVMMGDSFAQYPYAGMLAEHCSRLVLVGTYHFEDELIERERPQVVICEMAERILQAPAPPLPRGSAYVRR